MAQHRLAMVYGGGGVVGIAYTAGVAAGLATSGIPVAQAPALGTSARLLFGAGKALWGIDPKTGTPIESVGEKGKIEIPPTVVAPTGTDNVAE